MKEWVISDTHFGHQNIIDYCSRPYTTAPQMDADLERRWKNRVGPEDIIYHLGDVGYMKGTQEDQIRDPASVSSIIHRLPGKKILILGNHDKSAGVMRELGFDAVCQSMVVRVPNMTHCWVLLNHRPLRLHPFIADPSAIPSGISYVIHGHIHNSTPATRARYTNKGELVDIPDFNINVSVEMTNYEPIPLERVVKEHIKKLKVTGRYG